MSMYCNAWDGQIHWTLFQRIKWDNTTYFDEFHIYWHCLTTDNIWLLKSTYPDPWGNIDFIIWNYSSRLLFLWGSSTSHDNCSVKRREKRVINETTAEWSSFYFESLISLCTFCLINTSALLRTALYRGLNQFCVGNFYEWNLNIGKS